jgi:hypothetical protein
MRGKFFCLLSELSIDAFLGAISDTEGNVSSLLACVNLSSLKGLNSKGPREKADAQAKKCGNKSSTDLCTTVYTIQESFQLHATGTIAPKCISVSISQRKADMKVQSYVIRMQWTLLTAMAGCL